MSPTTTLLFVCPHNANRSQIAAGYAQHLAEGRAHVVSAGPTPADEDWTLTDPAGRDLESLRPMRDEIKHRVEGLLASLP
jgi:protein-tyrosine-phosphatase